MWILEDEYPALAADAVNNPDSARLLALLTKTEKALNERPPLPEKEATPSGLTLEPKHNGTVGDQVSNYSIAAATEPPPV